MYRNLLLLFATFAFATQAFSMPSKSADDVSATIKDNTARQPIEFATVELLNEKDSLLIVCMADSKGHFEITPPAKVSRIRVKFVGYKTYVAPVADNDLGTLLMEPDAQQLDGVIVTASNKTNKVDRDVYYVNKDLRAGTVTSQELLGRLSGVTFNQYDKSITVNGSSKVLILVDGIEKDQDMIKNLPSDRIERVEVIKDPVGKYATDGYTSVINIILKKDYAGIDVFVTNTTFLDFVGSNGGDIFTQNMGNVNVTYTRKKLNVYTAGNLYSGNFNIPAEYIKQYGNYRIQTTPKDEDHTNSAVQSLKGKINLGADYTISKKHLVSAEFKYSGGNDKSSTRFDIINSVNDVVRDSSFSLNNNRSNSDNMQGTLTYKGKFDQDNSLDADVRYSYSNGSAYNYYGQDQFLSETNIKSKGNYVRSNVNYSHQFSPSLNMDFGYGNVYSDNTNTLLTHSFVQREYRNRLSLYASYKPTDKINTKVGGILENYHQKNTNAQVNKTAFLPFVNVQYIPNKSFNLVAKYHASSEYPEADQISVFKTAQDSLLWSAGNPNLKTGINHDFSLDFNLMNFLTLTPYFSFADSKIASYVSPDPEDTNYYLSRYVNAQKYRKYGASLNFTLPLGKKIFWQNRVDWNRSYMAYHGESYAGNNLITNLSLFYVEQQKGWVLGAVYQKRNRKDIGIQGYTSDGNDMVLLFMQKSFPKQKLDVAFLYILPLQCLNYDQTTMTRSGSYYQKSTGSLGLIKNLTFVQLSYRFNAGKQVVKKTKEDEPETERTRRGGLSL